MARRLTKKVETAPVVEEVSNTVDEVETVETPVEPKATKVKTAPKLKVRENIPMNELVTVRNATQGQLNIVDSDGFSNVMDNFGDEIEMEMSELFVLKKRYPRVFKENWIELTPIVLNALGVEKFYQGAMKIDELDELFQLSEKEIKEKVSKLNDVTKRSIGMRAINLIETGELDSVKKIKAFEEALGYQLIEK